MYSGRALSALSYCGASRRGCHLKLNWLRVLISEHHGCLWWMLLQKTVYDETFHGSRWGGLNSEIWSLFCYSDGIIRVTRHIQTDGLNFTKQSKTFL
jgi:hypothetical protein